VALGATGSLLVLLAARVRRSAGCGQDALQEKSYFALLLEQMSDNAGSLLHRLTCHTALQDADAVR
jgi:hypothetical protein